MAAARRTTAALCAALLAGAAGAATTTSIVTIFRSATIHMPLLRARPPAHAPAYVERKGPRCIDAAAIAGAAVMAPDAVDFVLRGGERLRARLDDDCPALGFYGGFYMSPGADGRICAGRDAIRTRAGGECGIDRFRRLEPPRPPKP